MMRVRARSVVDPMLKHRATKPAGLAPYTPRPITLTRIPLKGQAWGPRPPSLRGIRLRHMRFLARREKCHSAGFGDD